MRASDFLSSERDGRGSIRRLGYLLGMALCVVVVLKGVATNTLETDIFLISVVALFAPDTVIKIATALMELRYGAKKGASDGETSK